MNKHQIILSFVRELKKKNNPPCPECGFKNDDAKETATIHHFHCKKCGFTLNID